MKPINPEIVCTDINSPMTKEELKRKKQLEQIIKDNWIDEKKFDYEQGKRLYELREGHCWQFNEVFRIKTGKNKGKWEKKPKFDKYLKQLIENHKLGTDVPEMKRQIKVYEGHIRQKAYFETQLKILKLREEANNDR